MSRPRTPAETAEQERREAGLLLVFYAMLVATMFVEVLRRERPLLFLDLGRGDRTLLVHLPRLDRGLRRGARSARTSGSTSSCTTSVQPRPKALLYLFGDLVMLAVSRGGLGLLLSRRCMSPPNSAP